MSVYFLKAAAPGAYLAYDMGTNRQLPGSVTTNIGGTFTYQCSHWNGTGQAFDSFSAETLGLLGERIAAYWQPQEA